MQRGEEFVTADLTRDARVPDAVGRRGASRFRSAAAAAASARSSALDRAPSAREPRLAPSMLRAVRVLLEPAAVALDNALLLKRAEALSVTDDLTHLYNSRYLNQVLRRETKRASRSGRPLSLLFIDLDGFKAVNDTHGHLFGSRALVEAAAVIRGSARETDVVARFGGDEFALVLPDTGGEGAFAVGERIRERIAAHTFPGRRRPRHPPHRLGRRRHAARRGRLGRGAGAGRRQGDVPGQGFRARTVFRPPSLLPIHSR